MSKKQIKQEPSAYTLDGNAVWGLAKNKNGNYTGCIDNIQFEWLKDGKRNKGFADAKDLNPETISIKQ